MSLPGAAERDGSASPPRSAGRDQSFPRSCRLTARKQFHAVYRQGRRVKSSSFTLIGLPNSVGYCRLGIAVTRKVGGAAERNRIKRVLREVFRSNRKGLAPPLDLVVSAHPGIERRTTLEIGREFLQGFDELARRFRR